MSTINKINVGGVDFDIDGDGTAAVNANLAPIEETTIASKAYAVDDYLVYDAQLYKVKAAIAQGDTLTIGTNIEETTIGGELENLSSDAVDINYDDTTTQIGENNVQGAIEWLKTSFSNALTSLKATDVAQFVGATGSTFASVISSLTNILQTKSVTATTSAQTVSPDSGKVLSSVTVNPQSHSATRTSVTANGTIDLGTTHNYRYVPVSVSNSRVKEVCGLLLIPGTSSAFFRYYPDSDSFANLGNTNSTGTYIRTYLANSEWRMYAVVTGKYRVFTNYSSGTWSSSTATYTAGQQITYAHANGNGYRGTQIVMYIGS